MERSFREEVKNLRLGAGETFHGEGILAVTKALLQSGVGYISGYPGAPVSHLVDVLTDASDILDELGVHFEPAANEAAAAATLGASINYPIRGAATWKSVVGTNVASDALNDEITPAQALAQAIRAAHEAALSDPEGDSLARGVAAWQAG